MYSSCQIPSILVYSDGSGTSKFPNFGSQLSCQPSYLSAIFAFEICNKTPIWINETYSQYEANFFVTTVIVIFVRGFVDFSKNQQDVINLNVASRWAYLDILNAIGMKSIVFVECKLRNNGWSRRGKPTITEEYLPV